MDKKDLEKFEIIKSLSNRLNLTARLEIVNNRPVVMIVLDESQVTPTDRLMAMAGGSALRITGVRPR